MENRRVGLVFTVLMGVGVGALLGCAPASKRSLDGLLSEPLSTGQHEVIAERYRDQASEARSLAAYHVALAAKYRSWSGSDAESDVESLQAGAEMVRHCQALAQSYEQVAEEYEALAASHASLAKSPGATPERELPYDRTRSPDL